MKNNCFLANFICYFANYTELRYNSTTVLDISTDQTKLNQLYICVGCECRCKDNEKIPNPYIQPHRHPPMLTPHTLKCYIHLQCHRSLVSISLDEGGCGYGWHIEKTLTLSHIPTPHTFNISPMIVGQYPTIYDFLATLLP